MHQRRSSMISPLQCNHIQSHESHRGNIRECLDGSVCSRYSEKKKKKSKVNGEESQ